MFLDKIPDFQATLGRDLLAFLPELIVCGTIVLLLILRLFPALDRWHLSHEALTLTVLAFLVAVSQWHNHIPTESFAGMLRFDAFAIFLKVFLLGMAALTIWLGLLTGVPAREDSADFCTLLLGATLGMMLMASANHLLMVFIAVEMASIPSFALAGFLKGNKQSSEASLKYVVYGGGAAGIMLYGISLIAGKFGTGYLPDLAQAIPLAAQSPAGSAAGVDLVLLLGILFILVGLGFKLAAVPFHFWCPDVFEGAAAEVAGFLSVASKAAALALVGRLALVLTNLGAIENLTTYLVPTLALLAAITATFGNLAAYPQTNLKRLFAYSTIAQAGYMMMGLATLSPKGTAAVLFYLIAYLFMNLGAFAVIAFLRNITGSEDLASFRGLIQRAPVLVITLAFFILSLLGVPPLAGFAAKFQIFRVLVEEGNRFLAQNQPGLAYTLYALLVVAAVNTVISVVYYVKVLKVMIIDKPLEEVEGKEPAPLPVAPMAAFYTTILASAILLMGLFWNRPIQWSDQGVRNFSTAAPLAASTREAMP